MADVTILILGHRGMLGRTLVRYFSQQKKYSVVTTATRWGDTSFINDIQALQPQFIINCIGKIPQKNPSPQDYLSINIELPHALETLGIPVIHPSTDCEFKGTIAIGDMYTKTSRRDAEDVYGKTKADISKEIETTFNHTKIIRTSIIGHEEQTSVALLDWFLAQEGSVRGFTNHYWNGITTLQWAKQAEVLMDNWDTLPVLNQYGTVTHYSKYDLLSLARSVYKKDIEIIPFATETTTNKCLQSDTTIPELEKQLHALREFFSEKFPTL